MHNHYGIREYEFDYEFTFIGEFYTFICVCGQGCRLYSAITRGQVSSQVYASWPDGATGWTSCSGGAACCGLKLGKATGWALQLRRLLVGLCCWERSLARLSGQQGFLLYHAVGRGWRLWSWLGWDATWDPWSGGAAGYAPQLGVITHWAPFLGQAIGCVQQSGRALGCALLLGGVVGWLPWWQDYMLGSKVAQGHCSGSLVTCSQKLCLSFGQGFWLGSLPRDVLHSCQASCPGFSEGQDWRLCSTVETRNQLQEDNWENTNVWRLNNMPLNNQ